MELVRIIAGQKSGWRTFYRTPPGKPSIAEFMAELEVMKRCSGCGALFEMSTEQQQRILEAMERSRDFLAFCRKDCVDRYAGVAAKYSYKDALILAA